MTGWPKRIYRFVFIVVLFLFMLILFFGDELTKEIGIPARTLFYYLIDGIILLFWGQKLVELYSLRSRDPEDARKLVEDVKQKIQQATQEMRERESADRDNTITISRSAWNRILQAIQLYFTSDLIPSIQMLRFKSFNYPLPSPSTASAVLSWCYPPHISTKVPKSINF